MKKKNELSPKRQLFQQVTDDRSTAAAPERTGTRESSRDDMRRRLALLEGDVQGAERRESLSNLRESVDFQRDAVAEDGREVEDLLRMVQTQRGLETAELRQRFFSNLEERMSLLISMLLQSGRINQQQLNSQDLSALIASLNPAQVQIAFRGGNRQLFDHEQQLLRIPALLDAHANAEVKTAWAQSAARIKSNAAILSATQSFFGVNFSGSNASAPGAPSEIQLDPAQQRLLDQAKSYWGRMHPLAQAAVLATAVYGAWSIFKWVFRRGSDNEPGRLSKIGFLVAGGVFIAGGILGYRAVWEKIKGFFVGLSRAQFLRGIRALVSGDWEGAREAWGEFSESIMNKLGLGEHARRPRTETATTRPSTVETTQNRQQLRYAATRDTLIGFFCISERTYSDADRVEIRQVFNAMRGQSVHRIHQLWEANKTNSSLTIANDNGVVRIDDSIQQKNIFTAVRIIGSTYEIYRRRFNIDTNTPMTLGQFLERVAGDPLHEAGSTIHQSMLEVVSGGSINFSQLNLDRLRDHFAQRQRQHTDQVCSKLGVNIQSLSDQEKNDFYGLAASLYRDARLAQSADEALQNIGTTGRSARSIEKARLFFTRTKERTLQTVLPGVITRYNISQPQNADNANILRDHLTEQRMTFGHAFQLNVVSANFDFGQSAAASEFEELSLLFVALHGLPTEQRNRYYSELSYLMLNEDTTITMPSLARLKPYFGRLTSLAVEVLDNKRRTVSELISAFANERTPEQEAAFQERVRNSDWLEFGLIAGQEGVRGSYLVGKDVCLTLGELGATYEDFGAVEDVGDFLHLTLQLGGALILPGERNGQGTGMIYLAGKYFFIKPLNIGWDTLVAAWEGQEGDTSIGGRFSAAFKTYTVGAAAYVMIGAAGGLVSGGGWRGIVRGAARGLAAPVTAPVEGIRVGQRAVEAGRQFFTRGTLPNLLRNAQMIDYYRSRMPANIQLGEWFTARGVREGGRRVLVGNWNVSRYHAFLHNFRRSYNSFFGFSAAEGIAFRTGEMERAATQVQEAAERVRNFTRAMSTHADYARATNVEGLQSLIQRVGVQTGLLDKEMAILISKVETSGGVQNVRASIDAGAEALSSTSRSSRARAAFTAALSRMQTWYRNRGITPASSTAAAGAVDTVTPTAVRTAAVADTLQAIRAGEAVDLARMTQLDAALRTPEGVQEARRALSAMGVADDQVEVAIRAVRTAENPVALSQALQRAGVIAEVSAPAASTTAAASEAPRAVVVTAESAEAASRALQHLDSALEAIRTGGTIGWRELGALRVAAQSDDFVESLRAAGLAADKAQELATVLRSSRELGAIAQTIDGLGTSVKLGRGLTGLLRIGKVAGPALAAAGFVAGGLEAWQSWAIADEIQNNEELKDLYNARGTASFAFALGNLALDIAALAGAISGLALLPLTVILFNIGSVVNISINASIEIAKTEEDWKKEMYKKAFKAVGLELEEGQELTNEQMRSIQQQAVNLMIHAIVNTTEDDSAGENFNAIFTSNTVESFMDERANTRQKMMWAILKIERPGRDDDYYKYAFKAINTKTGNFNFRTFEHGKKVIAESLIFADIMAKRDQRLSYRYGEEAAAEATVAESEKERLLSSEGMFDNGQERILNLQHSRFDAATITNRDILMVISSGEHMVERTLKEKIGNELFERIKGLDKNYLNYAINVMAKYVKDAGEAYQVSREDSERIAETAELLRRYLMFEGYQFQSDPRISDPHVHMADVNKVIFDASISEEQLQEYTASFTPSSKGLAALDVYARAYGFKLAPTLFNLKAFFEGEGKKGYMGLYYRRDQSLPGGGVWVMNEEGIESDNECGYNPDVAVLNVIREIREDPNNILTSRFDSWTDALTTRDDEIRRTNWMLELADRMERAYNSSSAPANTQEFQTPAEAALDSLATDTSSGYSSLRNDPTTALKMAAQEANDVTVRNLDNLTGGRYSTTVNNIRSRLGSVIGNIIN